MRRSFYIIIIFLGSFLFGRADFSSENRGLYSFLNNKSWSEILEEKDCFQWQSPYTVNLLLSPPHSPDWIYLNPSMVVSRRRVIKNVSSSDVVKKTAAETQEDLVVQFAFDDPVFIPNFRLTNLSLEKDSYPIATADYFANDIYYEVEYMTTSLDERQTLLCMNISIKNEGEYERDVHVRTKIGYYPENSIFDYHYIPFDWTVAKWKAYEGISFNDNVIYKNGQAIGTTFSEQMSMEWEEIKKCTDTQYEEILYPQVWYGSGYVLPEFRLKDIQDVIHASKKLSPGDSTNFCIKLLVNEDQIVSEHEKMLFQLSPQEIKYRSINGFDSVFTENKLSCNFSTENWSNILTSLQMSISQLLVRFPNEKYLLPTQGGSSERFYVWVFEAVQMLRPLLRTGSFEEVRMALDYIFSLQDSGFPPVGHFTTTEGAVGTTGPRWANTTGMALVLACDYYLYSKDQEFIKAYLPKILKAMHWIIGEVKATRILNSDGTRPLTYGLMPFAVASDGDEGYFVSATDLFSYWGVKKAVCLLESINHKEFAHMKKELELYKEDLLIAIQHLARADGYIDRKLVIGNKKNNEAKKFVNTDIMAPIATVGIMSPEDEIFQKYIDYYENQIAIDFFMGQMDRDIFYMIQCEHYWQPIYLMLGEWKKAFMTLHTCLRYGMTQDTHQTQERFDKRNPAFAPWQPNGSGSGRVIDMLLNALYFENNSEEVTLLGCVPFEYLLKNKSTLIKKMYTLTGVVDMEVVMIDKKHLKLEIVSNHPLPKRLRLPEHFKVQPIDTAVKSSLKNIFCLEEGTNHVVFLLTKVE